MEVYTMLGCTDLALGKKARWARVCEAMEDKRWKINDGHHIISTLIGVCTQTTARGSTLMMNCMQYINHTGMTYTYLSLPRGNNPQSAM